MTETTREIFEKYQIRKSKKQKTAFISYLEGIAQREGYSCKVERGSLGARNIVVGDVGSARVVYTAHYDTCPVLPFPNFITPKSFLIYLLYQLALVVVILAAYAVMVALGGVAVGVVCAIISIPEDILMLASSIISFVAYIVIFYLLLAGPANKHTANDNTSGVTTLIDLMIAMPENLRDSVAFVFFDMEELGLVGSSSFASAHKKEMKDKLLINFDCVSDGDHFILALRSGAAKYKQMLDEAYASGERSVEVLSKGVFYPSDQMVFPVGVGIAALKRSKSGILYMDRIHTTRDTIYNEENIAYLVCASCRLAELVCEGAA